MPPNLNENQCPYCLKKFFTYETDKKYCNDECKAHEIYDSRYYDSKNIRERVANKNKIQRCIECGSETLNRKLCSHSCKTIYEKKMKKQIRDSLPKTEPKKRHKLPYEVLNMIAEKKRIMEDSASLYRRNREKI